MSEPRYYLDIIRELERNIGTLTEQLNVERSKRRRELTIDVQPTEVRAIEPERKKVVMPRNVAGAVYIEGIAYESRNFRHKHKHKQFNHLPIAQVAVFASDADAQAYARERTNPGFWHRMGACIIEKVPEPPKSLRRKRRAKVTKSRKVVEQLNLPD